MAEGQVRDFASDDGEWVVENGDFATVAGPDAVGQAARIKVGMILGECFLDESIGVDYIGVIMAKDPDELAIAAELQAPLAAVPDVTEVRAAQLLVDPATREASISFELSTIYGEQVSETVALP